MTPTILTVVLRAQRVRATVGESIPISVAVRNVSRDAVWVVGVVDGSESGQRYPFYQPLVMCDGQALKRPPPEDPLVSPLRVADFRLAAEPVVGGAGPNRQSGA